MRIMIPVVSTVPASESYLFKELEVEQGYTINALSEIPREVLQSPSIIWEVENKDEMIDIRRLRRGLYRDFICIGDRVQPIHGLHATNQSIA